MIVRRVSRATGKSHEREIDVTLEQIERWKNGELIQRVMPHLTSDEREFIMTGITPTEWEELFPKEDE